MRVVDVAVHSPPHILAAISLVGMNSCKKLMGTSAAAGQ
jgi:hypothetical protein